MRAALEVLAQRHAASHLTVVMLEASERRARDGKDATSIGAWEVSNRAFSQANPRRMRHCRTSYAK